MEETYSNGKKKNTEEGTASIVWLMLVHILGKKKQTKYSKEKRWALCLRIESRPSSCRFYTFDEFFIFFFQIFSLHLSSTGSIGAQRFCTLIALRVCGIDAHIYTFIILSKKRKKNKTISSLYLNGKKKHTEKCLVLCVSTLYMNKTQNTKKKIII